MTDQVFRADSPAPEVRWVLQRLLEILDTAVSLQPETEAVLRCCVVEGAVAEGANHDVLARQAGRLTSALLHLVDRANALPGSLVVDEARALLRYHHRLLTGSLEHAFGPSAVLSHSNAAPPLTDGCDCLGEPAARLRRLQSLIAADLSDDRHPPSFPVHLGHQLP